MVLYYLILKLIQFTPLNLIKIYFIQCAVKSGAKKRFSESYTCALTSVSDAFQDSFEIMKTSWPKDQQENTRSPSL